MKERDELIEEAKLRLFMGEQQFPTKWSDVAELAADFALQVLERSIYREICEAAQRMKFADHISLYPFEGGYAVVKTREGVGGIQHFDTLPEAFEFVKGTGSRWEFIEKATKDIDSWTDSEKAEIHPQRALNSTQETK